MKRLLITTLTLTLGTFHTSELIAATRNWLAQPELYCSPVPRQRHGKTGIAQTKREARKYKSRRAQHAKRG